MWWYRRWHSQKELVAECEAFLSGHYAERLQRQSHDVPGWAWTNLLAHGTDEDLRADRSGPPDPLHRSWPAARAYLSTEVLTAVRRGRGLQELQCEVLQPLELDLGAQGCSDPRRWVRRVTAALASAGRHDRAGTLARAGHDGLDRSAPGRSEGPTMSDRGGRPGC